MGQMQGGVERGSGRFPPRGGARGFARRAIRVSPSEGEETSGVQDRVQHDAAEEEGGTDAQADCRTRGRPGGQEPVEHRRHDQAEKQIVPDERDEAEEHQYGQDGDDYREQRDHRDRMRER